jgi:hypothetical protein
MSELSSKFSRDDISTLLEAMSEWESLGNQELYLLNTIKGMPLPPEDHEAYEMVSHIKSHFQQKEKSIRASHDVRQEKAVFLKAKLMLVRRDMGIDKLFEMAAEDLAAPPIKKEAETVDESPTPTQVLDVSDAQKKLERAEFFIRDLGVWTHYEKFLATEVAQNN